ncbi:MAG: VWA-like domain-containing protein [Ruminococcus sp.]|nr:VWA-like domain-containing protein [Ruminococcus sp.]
MNKSKQIEKLSYDVLQYSRNTIMVNLRFLDAALSRLMPMPNKEIHFGTDGKYLVFTPKYLLKRYVDNAEFTVHDHLHTLFHCIFRHNFVSPVIDRRLWKLACDIATESMIISLGTKIAKMNEQGQLLQKCNYFESQVKTLTAEKIYRHLQDGPMSEEQLKSLENLFYVDDHRLWYMTDEQKQSNGIGGDDGNANDNNKQRDKDNSNNDGNSNDDVTNDDSESQTQLDGSPPLCSEEDWQNIAERIQVDMETLSKSQGDMAGGLLQGLREVNRERYDYTAFLKKFAVMGEAMQVNDDEFDYIFYTYGLKLYKNMPLIEPLEYKEVKRIREFVIAIDTSGSVSGELVQTFLQKTYNIMKQTESFFNRINIHIIQCDADIQEHVKITSQEEFDEYLKVLSIRGLGGTDFRPVFQMVDRLIDEKEFSNLKGLIYFTDGWGTFPSKKPNYETAFIFIKEDYFNEIVPPWAIKLILDEDEI